MESGCRDQPKEKKTAEALLKRCGGKRGGDSKEYTYNGKKVASSQSSWSKLTSFSVVGRVVTCSVNRSVYGPHHYDPGTIRDPWLRYSRLMGIRLRIDLKWHRSIPVRSLSLTPLQTADVGITELRGSVTVLQFAGCARDVSASCNLRTAP